MFPLLALMQSFTPPSSSLFFFISDSYFKDLFSCKGIENRFCRWMLGSHLKRKAETQEKLIARWKWQDVQTATMSSPEIRWISQGRVTILEWCKNSSKHVHLFMCLFHKHYFWCVQCTIHMFQDTTFFIKWYAS